MGAVTNPRDAAVVFFWSNGTRFVAFPAGMTYFRTRDGDHYAAIKNVYDTYGVPYFEEPTSQNRDSRIFGVEIRAQEEVWTGTEVEYENQKGPDGKPLPVDSGKGARDTMKRSFQATNGQVYRNADVLAKIARDQAAQAEAVKALQETVKAALEVVKPTNQ